VHEVELKVPWLIGKALKAITSPFIWPYPVIDAMHVECCPTDTGLVQDRASDAPNLVTVSDAVLEEGRLLESPL